MQEAPIHQSLVFGQIKISRKIFEKGHPRNIGPTVPEEKIFKELLKKFISLPWQPEFLMESNSVNNFEEDLLRNIPAKFGPNWPSGLGGEDV